MAGMSDVMYSSTFCQRKDSGKNIYMAFCEAWTSLLRVLLVETPVTTQDEYHADIFKSQSSMIEMEVIRSTLYHLRSSMVVQPTNSKRRKQSLFLCKGCETGRLCFWTPFRFERFSHPLSFMVLV